MGITSPTINSPQSEMDAAAMIRGYQSNPLQWVIEGLLSENEIMGLHGPQEVFKTIFCLQLQEALASGRPFLGVFNIPEKHRVLLVETEMSSAVIGRRLAAMYRNETPPPGMLYPSEADLLKFRRAVGLERKFQLVDTWVKTHHADVLILDTANPFFRGGDDPNSEVSVGQFFDLLTSLPAPVRIFARHNHKRRDNESGDDATLIRGSGQWADVPDLLIQLKRKDRRTNEATFAISKFRHGTWPEDFTLWFDPQDFRLTGLPPVIHILFQRPCTREELLGKLETSFGVAERKGKEMLAEQMAYLIERPGGRAHVLEIDREAAKRAPWVKWCLGETVQDMHSCA